MPEEIAEWKETLPEGFADAPFFKAAETPEAALQDIQNAAAHMGNSIRIPSEDAGEDDMNAFYAKVLEKAPNLMPKPTDDNMDSVFQALGRPENVEGYKYEPPEGRELPDDYASFATIAHEAGLSQTQFNQMLGKIMENEWQSADIAETEQAAAMKELSKEWGVAYDQNLSHVKNFLRLTDAPEGIVDLISEGAMSPTEIKWLHSIATQTKAPKELVDIESDQKAALTPEEARARIQELLNAGQDGPYFNAAHPGHKDAMAKMHEYQKAAIGQR